MLAPGSCQRAAGVACVATISLRGAGERRRQADSEMQATHAGHGPWQRRTSRIDARTLRADRRRKVVALGRAPGHNAGSPFAPADPSGGGFPLMKRFSWGWYLLVAL